MKKYYILGVAATILISMVGVSSSSPVKAIGVSPSRISATDLVNGLKVKRTVGISRRDASRSAIFSVAVSGPDAKDIALSTTTIKVASGVRSFSYTFYIQPQAAAQGAHHAQLTFLETVGAPTAGAKGVNQVTLLAGAAVTVDFTITERQVKMFKIYNASVNDTEVGQPMVATVDLENQGNIDVRPDKIQLLVSDATDPSRTSTYMVDAAAIPFTSPFVRQNISIPMPHGLPQGTYAVKIIISDDAAVIFKTATHFAVFPPGTLAQKVDWKVFLISGSDWRVNDLLKFSSQVLNSGQIATEVTAYVEIKQDGKTLELLRSEKKMLYKDTDTENILTWRPNMPGSYTAEAYWEYGPRKTLTKKLSFIVQKSRFSQVALYFGAAVGLVFVGGVTVLIVRRRHKKTGRVA